MHADFCRELLPGCLQDGDQQASNLLHALSVLSSCVAKCLSSNCLELINLERQ